MAEPTREEIENLDGPVIVEFGANWCPHCQAIRSFMKGMLAKHPHVRHIQIEDGPGRPLGRSFRVKLWPTLVFLRDGEVVSQMARPSSEEITSGFAGIWDRS
jgi:thioredoxin 1